MPSTTIAILPSSAPRLAALSLALLLAACANGPQEDAVSTRPTTPENLAQTQQPRILPAPLPNPVPAAPNVRPEPAPPVSTPPAAPAAKLREETRRAGAADASRELAAPAHFAVMPAPSVHHAQPEQRERYQSLTANPMQQVAQAPVSTFSIDVDTGSYSNVRRMLNAGQLPPADAVRVEELVNYFPYDYAPPQGKHPFAVHTELAAAPWKSGNVLMRIAIKGQDLAKASLPPANLVFLVDVSGSMHSPDKLPLLQSSLKLLVNELRPQDRITLVTYAGNTSVVLPPTSGSERVRIAAAIDGLRAGGSTAGASGIALAYQAAQQAFIPEGINRILLATDGDFNVGVTDFRQLKSMVEEKRQSGIALSTLGFGSGNYNEQLMEQLADAGDGAYTYIDNLMEGHKLLANEMSSTLATIARDVKIQVEFNPAAVREYRLIGYENRALKREDFNNDRVDAGDIGAGHTVTALYELTLADGKGLVDDLRYGRAATAAPTATNELAHVKLRYKQPGAQSSQLLDSVVMREAVKPATQMSSEFRFATAVAGFGQLLRGGEHTGAWRYDDVRALAVQGVGADRYGYRGEFLRMVDLAKSLATRVPGEVQARAGER
ncbi:MAG: von Willebrand factor type A domain-containing protein [Moraxellaceae bacterium]|nr:von Willebrand factor type A domain-containing protein [Moraxellaceae bacterium]